MIEKIKIGWREYSITKANPVLNGGDELYGEIDHIKNTITLRAVNTPDEECATLIHEVLHGIDVMYGISMEEEFVERLANALYTVLKDNGLEIRSRA